MRKSILVVLLATSTASFADPNTTTAAPDPATAASAPKKHRLHAPKLRPGAHPAENPQASFDKKGGN